MIGVCGVFILGFSKSMMGDLVLTDLCSSTYTHINTHSQINWPSKINIQRHKDIYRYMFNRDFLLERQSAPSQSLIERSISAQDGFNVIINCDSCMPTQHTGQIMGQRTTAATRRVAADVAAPLTITVMTVVWDGNGHGPKAEGKLVMEMADCRTWGCWLFLGAVIPTTYQSALLLWRSPINIHTHTHTWAMCCLMIKSIVFRSCQAMMSPHVYVVCWITLSLS